MSPPIRSEVQPGPEARPMYWNAGTARNATARTRRRRGRFLAAALTAADLLLAAAGGEQAGEAATRTDHQAEGDRPDHGDHD
jgi:hypothetical protein